MAKEELEMAHYRLSREDLEFIAQDIGVELVAFLVSVCLKNIS